MFSRRSPVRVLIAVVGALALSVAPLEASAATAQAVTVRDYPSAQCPKAAAGLQACVDGVQAGAVIRLTEEDLGEDVTITKSLTLRSRSGSLRPRLRRIALGDSVDHPGVTISISGLEVTEFVTGDFAIGPRDRVTITRSRVGTSADMANGIHLQATAPIVVDVEQSRVRSLNTDMIALSADTTAGSSSMRVVGTVLNRPSVVAAAAIRAVATGTGRLVVDVHNTVLRNGGIQLARGPENTLRADIVGNTFDHAQNPVNNLTGSSLAPGHATFNVFDNIVSDTMSGAVFAIPDGPTVTFRAGYNDFHSTGPTFLVGSTLSAGPGNLRLNPRFVDAANGNLRLRANSPLIDKGRACTAGGLEAIDAAGHFRWAGKDVDMGAFERGAGVPSGRVRIGTSASQTLAGTSGRDVLCGFGGNDTLKGGSGPDYLDGGSGADRLTGGAGGDRMRGGSGNDTLCARDGVAGNDTVIGGPGTDRGTLDPRDKRTSVEKTGGC